jgi:MHS family proline/betaine transporter-like MFS transporter
MYALSDLSGKTEIVEKLEVSTSYQLDNTDSIKVVSRVHYYTDGYQLLEATKFNAADIELGTVEQIVLNDDAKRMMILLVLIQVVFVTMVYGPIAAFLVELFPTRIRYTSMSLPYHIGNGIFGGLTPFIATSLYELSKSETNPSGDVLAGLWYPMGIAVISFIIGMIFLPKKIKGEVLEE